LLLCAGGKSTQMKDIKKAKAIKNTFLKRERNEK
jgi:putative component of toxin-antitoxin plasmid stabilization module